MNRFILIAASTLFLIASCGQKKVEQKEAAPTVVPEPTQTVSPFTPNPEGQLTLPQARFWLKSNASLDSLALAYADSLSVKDSSKAKPAADNYQTARESICKSNGITGGYKEYLWISKNIGNPTNKTLLDSLKLQTM